MSYRRLVLLLALLALSCGAVPETHPSATNAPSYASYGMMAVDSAVTVAALQERVGDEARLVYDTSSGQLLIFGPPAAHQWVRTTLRHTNALPRTVRVTVTFHEKRDTATDAAQTHAEIRTQQHVLVQSGHEGSVQVGDAVPFLAELISWGHRYGYLSSEVRLRHVGASLAVGARIIGDGPRVQLTLTPELSGVYSHKTDGVRFSKTATTLTVRAGETATLDSFEEHAEFYRLFLAGALGHTRMNSDQQITLTATLESVSDTPFAPNP